MPTRDRAVLGKDDAISEEVGDDVPPYTNNRKRKERKKIFRSMKRRQRIDGYLLLDNFPPLRIIRFKNLIRLLHNHVRHARHLATSSPRDSEAVTEG